MERTFSVIILITTLALCIIVGCKNENSLLQSILDDFEDVPSSQELSKSVFHYASPIVQFEFIQDIQNGKSKMKIIALNLTSNHIDSIDCILNIFQTNTYEYNNLIFGQRLKLTNLPVGQPSNDTLFYDLNYSVPIDDNLVEIIPISFQQDVIFNGNYRGNATFFRSDMNQPYQQTQVNGIVSSDGNAKFFLKGDQVLKLLNGVVFNDGVFIGTARNNENQVISPVRTDTLNPIVLIPLDTLQVELKYDNVTTSEATTMVKLLLWPID